MNGFDYARLRRIMRLVDEIEERREREKALKAALEAERQAEQAEREAEIEAQEAEAERIANLAGGLDPYNTNEGWFDPVAEARNARRQIFYR